MPRMPLIDRLQRAVQRLIGTACWIRGDIGQSKPNLQIDGGYGQSGQNVQINGAVNQAGANLQVVGGAAQTGIALQVTAGVGQTSQLLTLTPDPALALFTNVFLITASSGGVNFTLDNAGSAVGRGFTCGVGNFNAGNNGYNANNTQLTDGSLLKAANGAFNFQNQTISAAINVVSVIPTMTNTSGSTVVHRVAPTYNQASGSGNNTDLLINRTKTAVMSGTQLFSDWQVAGTSFWKCPDTGWSQAAIGTSTGFFRHGGKIFDHFADAGSTSTTETDLYSDTILANSLATNGDTIEACYGCQLVNSTSTKQLRAYFGGTLIFDSGALTISASSEITLWLSITRKSSTSVVVQATASTTGASTGSYSNVQEVTGLTLSSSNILKITGTAAGVGNANNDVLAKVGEVYYTPAA